MAAASTTSSSTTSTRMGPLSSSRPGRAPACPGPSNACIRRWRDGGVTAGGVALGPVGSGRRSREGVDPAMRRNQLMLALLGLGLALALVGCGRSPDGDRVASLSGAGATGTTRAPADGASRDPEQAALAFARCMRQHGVDMPDPEVDDQGRMTMRIGGPGAKPDPRKLEAAQRACGTPFGGDGPGRLDP